MVKNLRAKSADLERIFFDITQKSSKRVLKGSIGAPIPPKPDMRFRFPFLAFSPPVFLAFSPPVFPPSEDKICSIFLLRSWRSK
jgi:hypothetical protein